MKKFLMIALAIGAMSLAVSCQNKTVVADEPIHTLPIDSDIPTPKPVPPVNAAAAREKIYSLALNSKCAKTKHGNRGAPKVGYLKGVSLSFARSVCLPNREIVKIASQSLGDKSKDALALYGINASSADERMNILYSLMVGSAARESSFKWCSGIDESATNYNSETCEAGAYQTSYNSRSAHSILPKLYAEFKADKSGCFSEAYKEGITCSAASLKNWGTGEGVEFQRLSKDCTGFATEYHSGMLRTRLAHYGPIKRKESLILPECTSMFESIRKAIAADASLCSAVM